MTFNIEEIGELKILTCTTDDGSIFQLGSRYHKDKYQKIWAQNYTSSYSHAVYFVFGFGDGSYIRALLEAADENAHIIIYEPNSELIPFVTEHFDVSDILGDKHILLLAPDAVNNLAQQLAGNICNGKNKEGLQYQRNGNQYNVHRIFKNHSALK